MSVWQRSEKFQDDVSPRCIALEINKVSLFQKKDDDEHGMLDRYRRQPLELTVLFAPHFLRHCVPQGNCIFEVKGGKEERTYNRIQQTFDTTIRPCLDA